MLLTGIIYPLGIMTAAKMLFHDHSCGSMVTRNGMPVGSALLAQKFETERYFHPRPSACDFATIPSGAGNQGATSKALTQSVRERASKLLASHALPLTASIPADLLLASGSGLDPHISPEAMDFQLEMVARARNLNPEKRARLRKLARELIESPQFGIFGEPRVNVLLLNLALDDL